MIRIENLKICGTCITYRGSRKGFSYRIGEDAPYYYLTVGRIEADGALLTQTYACTDLSDAFRLIEALERGEEI